MRVLQLLSVAALFAATQPAAADTITQTIAFSGLQQDPGPDLYAAPFNAAIGTLTGIEATFTGTANPLYMVYGTVPPTLSTLNYFYDTLGSGEVGPGNLFSGSQGLYTLTQNANGYLTGPAENFSFSFSLNSSALYEYSYLQDLPAKIDIGDFSVGNELLGLPPFGADALGSDEGDLTFTYIYDLPEPGSLALLATAGLIVAVTKRRRFNT